MPFERSTGSQWCCSAAMRAPSSDGKQEAGTMPASPNACATAGRAIASRSIFDAASMRSAAAVADTAACKVLPQQATGQHQRGQPSSP